MPLSLSVGLTLTAQTSNQLAGRSLLALVSVLESCKLANLLLRIILET